MLSNLRVSDCGSCGSTDSVRLQLHKMRRASHFLRREPVGLGGAVCVSLELQHVLLACFSFSGRREAVPPADGQCARSLSNAPGTSDAQGQRTSTSVHHTSSRCITASSVSCAPTPGPFTSRRSCAMTPVLPSCALVGCVYRDGRAAPAFTTSTQLQRAPIGASRSPHVTRDPSMPAMCCCPSSAA